jgi:hypothetical protein
MNHKNDANYSISVVNMVRFPGFVIPGIPQHVILCGNNHTVLDTYRFSVESTVYVAPLQIRRGIGAQRYNALLERLRGVGVRVVLGGIALPPIEHRVRECAFADDEFSSPASGPHRNGPKSQCPCSNLPISLAFQDVYRAAGPSVRLQYLYRRSRQFSPTRLIRHHRCAAYVCGAVNNRYSLGGTTYWRQTNLQRFNWLEGR